jgi:excisionase family DNA binding protein
MMETMHTKQCQIPVKEFCEGCTEHVYAHGYREIRERILKERGEVCEHCGKERSNHVHHIDGSRTNHADNNLLVLCPKCHLGIFHKDRNRKSGTKRKLVSEDRPLNSGGIQLVTTKQAAKTLAISEKKVRELCQRGSRKGGIEACKIDTQWRIRSSEVDEFIKHQIRKG